MTGKRTDKTTGNYDTEKQLVGAVHAMKGRGQTQPVIAAACGVSVATVSRIMNPPKEKPVRLKLDDYWLVRFDEIFEEQAV
jgi:hypothetical protein